MDVMHYTTKRVIKKRCRKKKGGRAFLVLAAEKQVLLPSSKMYLTNLVLIIVFSKAAVSLVLGEIALTVKAPIVGRS